MINKVHWFVCIGLIISQSHAAKVTGSTANKHATKQDATRREDGVVQQTAVKRREFRTLGGN